MLQETPAIILCRRPFKDDCLIVSAYTQKFGRVNYTLYGAGSRTGGKRQAFLQPMMVANIMADYRPGRELQVVRSIGCAEPLPALLADPFKNTMALFLAEFLTRALKTNEQDELLFLFLRNSILWLNHAPVAKIANFHISFLVRLSVFLGFTPNLQASPIGARYFDLQQNEYMNYAKPGANVIDMQEHEFLRHLLRINYHNMHLFAFSRSERGNLLARIVAYYQFHIQGFGQLKTLDVLHELFD